MGSYRSCLRRWYRGGVGDEEASDGWSERSGLAGCRGVAGDGGCVECVDRLGPDSVVLVGCAYDWDTRPMGIVCVRGLAGRPGVFLGGVGIVPRRFRNDQCHSKR